MNLSKLKELALEKLDGIENKEYEVNLFLQDIFNLTLNQIHFNPDLQIEEKIDIFFEALDRRAKGEPYNYILNYKEFYGREFYVDNRVLIPRPETEIMVEECIKRNINKTINNYLDLCTGSGCIGITLKKELDILNATFSDISIDALDVCKINSIKHNIDANMINSDLFNRIEGKFDLITINPPYVPELRKEYLDAGVRDYEPNLALFSGENGLDIIRRIFDEIEFYITDNASIYMEFDETQASQIIKMIDTNKFNYKIFKDYNNMDRFIVIERR